MSYNIDSIDIIHRSDDFGIRRSVLFGADLDDGRLPEGNIINQLLSDGGRHATVVEADGDGDDDLIAPEDDTFWWHGEGSGSLVEELGRLLAAFQGEADLVLTWEGGDSHTGLRLRDAVVTEHEVHMALGEETS